MINCVSTGSSFGKAARTKGSCLIFFACCLLLVPCTLLNALDFSLRPKVFASFPLGSGNVTDDGDSRYGLGFGGELGFEVDLSTVWPNRIGLGYTAGLETGLLFNPLKGDEPSNISFYSFNGVAGLYYFPVSRLFTRLDFALGSQLSARNVGTGSGKSNAGMFLRFGGEAGFRFTPAFTLAVNTGYRQFRNSGSIRNSGMYLGLTGQLSFQTGMATVRQGIGASIDQYGEVFPVFLQLYQNNPIGSVLLHNNENAEIRNVRMYFRAAGYTASELLSASVSIIPRGRSVELPLYADFSPNILRFTDSGRILGELVIRYTFLGQEREAIQAITVATHNRNMVSGGDVAALAAFISPSSMEALDFARFIAGLERANRQTGHNNNMQYAMWLLEGLRASGVRLGESYSNENEAQFPAETLAYQSGTSRDLALLFAAVLEGVGIPSAFIHTEKDFLVALHLGIGQSAAETLFNGTDKILIINDEVWLPLSMTAFNDGFIAAWNEGSVILNQIFTQGMDAAFVIVKDAWAIYPPAPLPALGSSLVQTDTEAAASGFNRAMQMYITQEINPLIIRQQGNNTAVGQNRLGILLARAGRIGEAKSAYEAAAGMGSVPAMTNRGNLALTERDFATAERWFRQALQREAQNRAALRGLERVAGSR